MAHPADRIQVVVVVVANIPYFLGAVMELLRLQVHQKLTIYFQK